MSFIDDTNPRKLTDLLTSIQNRDTVLPDFQRDFVWQPGATMDLIISIAKQFPAGSILQLRDGSREFAVRALEGAPPISGHKHTYLILDGQQRLTSLYQAFYGKGKHRYFLDLRKLLKGGDFEDAIFVVRANAGRAQRYEHFANQANDLVLPLSRLNNYRQWMSDFSQSSALIPEVRIEDLLDDKINKWISAIGDYQFPVVTLKSETTIHAVCTIFEKLNRTGLKLVMFDLLAARLRMSGADLRERRDKMREEHPIIKDFDVNPDHVLQGILFASRSQEGATNPRSSVLDLDAETVDRWWDRTVSGLVRGLEILRDECKVLSPKWIPYEAMLSSLAAVLAVAGVANTAADGARREKIKRWFWCSVFSRSYDGAASTQANKDTGEMLRWFDGGAEPDEVRRFKFDEPDILRETTVRQRAMYRGRCV
ncbi:MAG: GmrSD restriction endonuclease domain-containing protein [Gammaproteobacteria bacterium]